MSKGVKEQSIVPRHSCLPARGKESARDRGRGRAESRGGGGGGADNYEAVI